MEQSISNVYYYIFYVLIIVVFIVVLKLPKKKKEGETKQKFVSTSKKFSAQNAEQQNDTKDI